MGKLSVAFPALEDKPQAQETPPRPEDFCYGLIRLDVLKIRAVAQLLEDITANMYECKDGLAEFSEQVDALSEALTVRVKRLEMTLEQEWPRGIARAAVGGAK